MMIFMIFKNDEETLNSPLFEYHSNSSTYFTANIFNKLIMVLPLATEVSLSSIKEEEPQKRLLLKF